MSFLLLLASVRAHPHREQCDITDGRLTKLGDRFVVLHAHQNGTLQIMCLGTDANLTAPTAPCVPCEHSFFYVEGGRLSYSARETFLFAALMFLLVSAILANDTLVAFVRRMRCCYTLTRIRAVDQDV